MPRIAWAWNVKKSETTSISPFAMVFGREPTTISRALARRYEGVKPTPGRVAAAAEEFRVVARKHAAYMRQLTADRLNKQKAMGKIVFEVGDNVLVYVPPNADEVKRRGRKAKHLYTWRGPCVVVEVLQEGKNRAYRVRHLQTKRVYTRSIVNTYEWKGDVTRALLEDDDAAPEARADGLHADETMQVGDVVAAREDAQADTFSFAEVLSIGDKAKVHFYVTTQKHKNQTLKKLKVYPGWHTGAGVMRIPPPLGTKRLRRFEGAVELDSDHIVVGGVKFRASGTNKKGFYLTAASAKKLAPFWGVGLRHVASR
jgi:hypothetical protein